MALLLGCILVAGLLTLIGFIAEDYFSVKLGISVMGLLALLSVLL